MSQFKYVNELTSLLNIDGPLTNVPQPRWQKKTPHDTTKSLNTSSKPRSLSSLLSNSSTAKTPTKPSTSTDLIRPRKTPTSKTKTPTRSTTPTPSKAKTPNGGDRFIPNRSATNFDLGHYKINKEENCSPVSQTMQTLTENLHGLDIHKQRILSYQNKAPAAPEGFQNPQKVIYTMTRTPCSAKASNRYIPQMPDRILDAPDIIDDYYLNLIDWGPNNMLAVALGAHVYLWDATTGKIEQLLELEGTDYACAVSWANEGAYLAVGNSLGTVQLWDCAQMRRLRVLDGHCARVGSLSWNSYIISSGCRSGQIIHHDVRQPDHIVATLAGHTQEVCGLKWSTDGRLLASGGNDNVLNVWESVGGQRHTGAHALHTLTAHQAAVKALAWCPWQPHLLASGGGTADRHIRFWNCNTGACVNAVDAKSQVCSLLWSSAYKEIVSGHGYVNNQLTIWKYPAMVKVAELTGHTARVLHLTLSPDGSTVLSAGADETLRLWKCFAKDPAKVTKTTKVQEKHSMLKQSIR